MCMVHDSQRSCRFCYSLCPHTASILFVPFTLFLSIQPPATVGANSATDSGADAAELQAKWDNDNLVLSWLDEKAVAIEASLQALRHERARAATVATGVLQPKGVVEGVVELIKQLDGAQKQEAMAALREAFGGSL